MSRGEVFRAGLLAAFLVAILVAMWIDWQDCSERGGKTVRGLFWLECIVPEVAK